MKEFAFPSERVKSLSEQSKSFDYTGMQKSPLQEETIVLEREQIDLIESHPLGFARCQVYNTCIIAEARGKLIIVDQHAAHERLVYECLKQKSSEKDKNYYFLKRLKSKTKLEWRWLKFIKISFSKWVLTLKSNQKIRS